VAQKETKREKKKKKRKGRGMNGSKGNSEGGAGQGTRYLLRTRPGIHTESGPCSGMPCHHWKTPFPMTSGALESSEWINNSRPVQRPNSLRPSAPPRRLGPLNRGPIPVTMYRTHPSSPSNNGNNTLLGILQCAAVSKKLDVVDWGYLAWCGVHTFGVSCTPPYYYHDHLSNSKDG